MVEASGEVDVSRSKIFEVDMIAGVGDVAREFTREWKVDGAGEILSGVR